PGQVLLRPAGWPVLWLQPSWGENDRAHRLELVAPGHDGWCQSGLRRHRRVLAARLYGKFEEDFGAGFVNAKKGRPDRALSGSRSAFGQAFEKRHAQDLRELPAWHDHNASRRHQCRSTRVLQSVVSRPNGRIRSQICKHENTNQITDGPVRV